MNIVIVNTQPVPSKGVGAASVNRILSYTKGLVNEGNNVCILSTAVGDLDNWQKYEGIPVKHLGKSSKTTIQRWFYYIGTSLRLLKELSRKEKDLVLFVTSNYFLTILLEIYCKINKIKIVNERGEFPFVLVRQSKWIKLIAPLYTNTAYKMLDGMVLMTKPLMEYYQKKVGMGCKLFEMPMTVDIDRFANLEKSNNSIGDYIAYCGSLSNSSLSNKNAITNLIEAFSMVEPLYPDLKLLLIGGTSNPGEMEGYKEAVASYGLHNVVFYGRVNRDEMPCLLKNAKALLLARCSNLQTRGGFPTKLGEYLATGNPVVVTAVGDVPLYLNSTNSFVVKPNDNKAFAERLLEVLADEEHAAAVGKEGQKLAFSVFNAKEQSKRLNQYLNELVGK